MMTHILGVPMETVVQMERAHWRDYNRLFFLDQEEFVHMTHGMGFDPYQCKILLRTPVYSGRVFGITIFKKPEEDGTHSYWLFDECAGEELEITSDAADAIVATLGPQPFYKTVAEHIEAETRSVLIDRAVNNAVTNAVLEEFYRHCVEADYERGCEVGGRLDLHKPSEVEL